MNGSNGALTLGAVLLAILAVLAVFVFRQVNRGPDLASDPVWLAKQGEYIAALDPAEGWQSKDGVFWRITAGGNGGAQPSVRDTVTVNYEGSLIGGEVFDSSFARGSPATFPLGGVVEAWRLVIPEMHVGQTIDMVVPADKGYGAGGAGPIPGSATLLFKVELLSIEG